MATGMILAGSVERDRSGWPPVAARQDGRLVRYTAEDRRPGSGFLRGLSCRKRLKRDCFEEAKLHPLSRFLLLQGCIFD